MRPPYIYPRVFAPSINIVFFHTDLLPPSPPTPFPHSFPHAAGGIHEPRWQQRWWTRTHRGGRAVFRALGPGGRAHRRPTHARTHTQAGRAAILKVTPHSGSERAAVRNHD